MQKLSSLSEMHSEYVQGRMNRKNLEGLVFQYLLDNFERFRLFKGDREKWIDFVSWLYPRLSRAIDYYTETGASFDAYIGAIVQWSCKEYKTREAEHYTTEFVCWKARAEEMLACNAEAEYTVELEEDTKLFFPFMGIKPRHILILLLKSYFFIDDVFLNRISLTIGMNKIELHKMIDKLHQLRSKREDKIHDLQERMHSQYYRCLTFERRLSSTSEGTAKHEKLKNSLDRAHKRYWTLFKRLEGIRKDATNQQVADVLNIPRGTVDSALHNIRKKWKQGNYIKIPGKEL